MVKRVITFVLRAGVPGLLIAIAVSRDEAISIRLWLAAAGAWIVITLLLQFLSIVPLEPARLLVAWQPRHRRPDRTVNRARGLAVIRAMLGNAQRNPRAHANEFRPRLIALAAHYLPVRHGIDPETDPARTADLLGDVFWLIDPTVVDRTPTDGELHRFLDTVLADAPPSEHPAVTK